LWKRGKMAAWCLSALDSPTWIGWKTASCTHGLRARIRRRCRNGDEPLSASLLASWWDQLFDPARLLLRQLLKSSADGPTSQVASDQRSPPGLCAALVKEWTLICAMKQGAHAEVADSPGRGKPNAPEKASPAPSHLVPWNQWPEEAASGPPIALELLS